MVRVVLRLTAGIVFAGALVAAIALSQAPRGPLKISGVLEADEVRVGSRVGGRVRAVHVAEGAQVTAGQLLVSLEPFDLEERLAQAKAVLGARRARLELMERGLREEEKEQARARRDETRAFLQELREGPRKQEIQAAREALRLAEAELELAARERERVTRLLEGGASTGEALDAARSRWKVASARVAAERERLALLEEGTRPEQIAQAEARLRQADAALAQAEAGFRTEDVAAARFEVEAAAAQLAALEQARLELEIHAPAESVVQALDLQPGDLVAANAPVLSLRDRSRLWVRAYVPALHLHRVTEGASLGVRVDGFGERAFTGTVSFVGHEAEFTPNNVQTPDERQRQVFRVKVDIDDPEGVLRPGMSADVILADSVEG